MKQQGIYYSSFPGGKGLQRPCLRALAGLGFNDSLTTAKDSAPCVEARQDDYIQYKAQGFPLFVCSFVRHATPPGFSNGVYWRLLLRD